MEFMKHIVRNISIFFIRITGIGFLYRRSQRKKKTLVRVVAFHDVSDGVWFDSILEMLTQQFHVLTPEAFHQENWIPGKMNVLLTFDDGYTSWLNVCAPILTKYNCKALFFINSGLIDVAHESVRQHEYVSQNLKLEPKETLSWSEVRELVAEGHTIGGHSTGHKHLGKLIAEEVRKEVQEDKRSIESNLGITVQDFAYPFGVEGDYTDETEQLIRSCHYAYVYTAVPGFVSTTLAHIPRTMVEKQQSPRSIRRWLLGDYDVFVRIKKSVKI